MVFLLVSAPFRLNIRVFQMLALILAAMAVPLVLIISGVRQISFKPAGPAPEAPGLRQSLEQAADKSLAQPAKLPEGRRVLVAFPGRNPVDLKTAVRQEAAACGGTVLEVPPAEGRPEGVLLVHVPDGAAARFEAALASWIDPRASSGESGGDLIEIRPGMP